MSNARYCQPALVSDVAFTSRASTYYARSKECVFREVKCNFCRAMSTRNVLSDERAYVYIYVIHMLQIHFIALLYTVALSHLRVPSKRIPSASCDRIYSELLVLVRSLHFIYEQRTRRVCRKFYRTIKHTAFLVASGFVRDSRARLILS